MSLAEASLAQRYQRILDRVSDYASQYQRQPSTIKLVAVSKRHSAEKIVELIKLGHRDFAENYLQEGVEKMERVKQTIKSMELENKIFWHFIGHIQSRKCREIAACFDWVHTIHSAKVADKLNQHRSGQPLKVLIQLNLQQQSSKSGVSPEQLPALVDIVTALPNLNLCGLMMIPELESDFAKQCAIFRRCRIVLEQLKQRANLDQLSMGMSADMQAAIAEGATQLRIGSAIFGPRQPRTLNECYHE